MISEVEIVNNNNTPLGYISDLKNFENGKVFKFNKGINIIIGKNGCGKTTLINLISHYMLCENSMVSTIPSEMFKLNSYFKNILTGNDVEFLDGVNVKSDYAGVVYHYLTNKDLMGDFDSALSNLTQFSNYYNNCSLSTGESVMNTLNYLVNYSCKNLEVQFPIEELINLKKRSNDFWSENIDMMLSYYKKNYVSIKKEDFEYTFLMDEVDANLDISNINMIYQILSYQKELTQLICVIHNPILIYKLSKLKYINFIEMTEGYLDEIKDVFNNL